MDELERELFAVGRAIAYPVERDATRRVLEQIEGRPWWSPGGGRPSWSFWLPGRRLVAVAVAVVALAVAGAMAVPSARSAILRWLHLGGIRVERVSELPLVQPRTPLNLGERVTVAEARARVDFRLQIPSFDAATTVYVSRRFPPGGRVSFLVGTPGHPRLLLTEFRGSRTRDYADKIAGPKTHAELLTIDGRPAIWISGAPHAFHFVDRSGGVLDEPLRLATNTLIWERSGLTLRFEGKMSRRTAIELARRVR